MIIMGRIYRRERLLVLSRWYVDLIYHSEVLGYSELRAPPEQRSKHGREIGN